MTRIYIKNGPLEALARLILYVMMRFVRRLYKKDKAVFQPGSPDDPADTLFGRLITKYAPGRSFADICCMWSMHGAVSFYAEQIGATKVTAFDAMDPTPEFEHARRQKGSNVRFVQGNIDSCSLAQAVGMHDVVWCTGLIYHTPEPFRVISDILSIAGEYAIIGSKTIPEIPGLPNVAVFLPGLDKSERGALLPFWGQNVKRLFGTYPAWDYEWWWALTGSAIASMIEVRPEWKVVSIHYRARIGANDNCVIVARRSSTIAPRAAHMPAETEDLSP